MQLGSVKVFNLIMLALFVLTLPTKGCLANEAIYFPKDVYEKGKSGQNGFIDCFTLYARWLKDGQQPSLWQRSQTGKYTEFRVFDTYMLIPINWPIVRLHVNEDGTGEWVYQIVYPNYMKPTGEDIDRQYGKPLTKSFKVSRKKVREFLGLVEKNKAYFDMPAYVQENAADGKNSMLECVLAGKYHVVRRNGLSKGPMENIGTALLDLVNVAPKDLPELIDKGETTE